MVATAWFDVAKAVTTGMRARAGYQAPTASGTGIPVYHSVESQLSNDIPPKILVIGWMGDADTVPLSPGSGDQQWATIGTNHSRNSTGIVRCAAFVSYGDAVLSTAVTDAGTIPAALDEAAGILNDLDAFLRADPSLGLTASGYPTMVAEVASVDLWPWLNEGHKVRAEASIKFAARI